MPEAASLEECVGYLEDHVVHDRKHFRYDRYLGMLKYCSGQLGSLGKNKKRMRDRTVVHVDLGTGPGVFHWAMHDCFEQHFSPGHQPQLVLLGYDRCPNMLELAKRIWKKFDLEYQPTYFSDAERLVEAVGDISSDARLVVTFGHVLIQANRTVFKSEIPELARLCGELSNSKRKMDIIAVDAYAYDYKNQFNRAVSKFIRKLNESSDQGKWGEVDIHGSVLSKGSRALIRRLG